MTRVPGTFRFASNFLLDWQVLQFRRVPVSLCVLSHLVKLQKAAGAGRSTRTVFQAAGAERVHCRQTMASFSTSHGKLQRACSSQVIDGHFLFAVARFCLQVVECFWARGTCVEYSQDLLTLAVCSCAMSEKLGTAWNGNYGVSVL